MCVTLSMFPPAFPEDDDGVVLLDGANYQAAMQRYEVLLVKFYAPWCGHCKAMAPEWGKAAKALKAAKSKVTLAKLDATVAIEAAESAKVNAFPTIKIFRKGNASDYTGGRTEAEIVEWVTKKSAPAYRKVATVADLQSLQAKYECVVVGVYANKASPHAKGFKRMAADVLVDSAVGLAVASADDVRAHLGVGVGLTAGDAVVALKTFDEGRNDLPVATGESFDLAATREFIASSCTPLVQEFSQKSAKKIAQLPVKQHVLLFSDADTDADAHARRLAALRSAATRFRGQVLALTVAASEKRVLDFFGVPRAALPTLFVADKAHPTGVKKYPYPGPAERLEDAEAVGAHVAAALAGEVAPFLKSESVAPEDTTGAVVLIKGASFADIVLNNDKDVFVEFYAPWCVFLYRPSPVRRGSFFVPSSCSFSRERCGHCKKLAPVWDKLGDRYKSKRDHVVIAKIDATANEIDAANVAVKGFPTLLFFKGNNKQRPVKYEGKRDLGELLAFVKNTATTPVNHDEL